MARDQAWVDRRHVSAFIDCFPHVVALVADMEASGAPKAHCPKDNAIHWSSLVTYLLPITAVVLGALVLRESPTVHAIVGMVIILSGAVLARYGVNARNTEKSHPISAHNRADMR